MKKRINNLPLKVKMLGSYVLIAVFPFLIATIISGSLVIHQTRLTSITHTAQIISQVTSLIDVYIRSIDKTSDSMALIIRNYNKKKFYKEKIQTNFNYITQANPEIAGVLFVFSDNTYVSINMEQDSRDLFSTEKWYNQALQAQGEMVLISNVLGRNIITNYGYSSDDVFSLGKAIIDSETNEFLGVLLFDIRHDIIKDAINSVSIGDFGFVFIIDDKDNIVYTPVNKVVYRIFLSFLPKSTDVESVKKPLSLQIQGKMYQIQVLRSIYTEWRTVGVFPSSEFLKNISIPSIILLVCMICILLLIFYISVFFSGSITSPILKLQHLMQQAETADLSVRFNSLYTDEIGNLGKSFNHMLERIQDLINQVYAEQQSKKKAEIKILQEQIKPHFLYNTLDTISWMAREIKAHDIVKIIDALTTMFRVGLSKGENKIVLREELKHVSSYLYIQKIRYRDKLTYKIEAESSCGDYIIPRILLQPLVENAIYHGIKKKRGVGEIVISTKKIMRDTKLYLKLEVRDNGAGMGDEKLKALKKVLQNIARNEEKDSFGLYYIAERLRLAYSNAYEVEIMSRVNRGTSISLMVPCEKQEK